VTAARLEDDGPRRLLWELPLALVLAAAALGAFLHLLTGMPERPPPPPPIEAQVLELPPPTPPAPPQAAPPPAPEPPPPPKLEPPPPEPPPPPKLEPPPPEPPPPPKLEPKPPPPRPVPKPPPPRTASPPPVAQPAAPPPVAPPPPAAAAPAPAPAAPSGGHMSARAIYKPMPEIPEALRRRAVDAVAVARFHVASDGSAQVELVQGTFEPTLNRALLETLKTWRFFPALDNGKPVADTFELRIPITVR